MPLFLRMKYASISGYLWGLMERSFTPFQQVTVLHALRHGAVEHNLLVSGQEGSYGVVLLSVTLYLH